MFTICNLENNELLIDRVSLADSDGRKAAKLAARLTKKTGRKYQPRRVDGDANWRERERARFNDGSYVQVCEDLQFYCEPHHFAHVAHKDHTLIAYTKDAVKGMADKQSLLSIEAYVKLVVTPSKLYHLSAAEMQAYGWTEAQVTERLAYQANDLVYRVNALIAKQREYVANMGVQLKFATTADEIAAVYTNFDEGRSDVANSCMRYDDEYFGLLFDGDLVHPSTVYASPDLAVAYLTNAKGQTTERALCWPEKKVYSRVYGSSVIHDKLKALGYVKSDAYFGQGSGVSLAGARLRRMELDRGGYLMPYIDEGSCVYAVQGDSEWFYLGHPNQSLKSLRDGAALAFVLECKNTNGRSGHGDEDDEENNTYCPRCDEACSDDDTTRVYLNASRTQYEYWCSDCVENQAFYCHGTSAYYCADSVDQVDIDGETHTLRYAEHNASWCDHSDEWTFQDMHRVIISTNDEGVALDVQTWCATACEADAAEFNGSWYSQDHVDCTKVVVERYLLNSVKALWSYNNGRMQRHTVVMPTYSDRTRPVPDFVLNHPVYGGAYYVGVDGRWYSRDHVDHHPMRERIAELVERVDAWALTYINTPQPVAPTVRLSDDDMAILPLLRADAALCDLETMLDRILAAE